MCFVHGKLQSMSAKSLILVTVDCLRADHVGFLGYSRPTTPFIDSLTKESFVVPNAIVGGVPTYYSFPALLASRHPLALGRDVIGLAPGETTLPSHLKQCGFTTACFSAANPYLSLPFGYDQAFDVFQDFLSPYSGTEMPYGNGGSNGLRRNLNRVIERVCRRLGPIGKLYGELYFQYCLYSSPRARIDSLRPFPAADFVVDAACEWLKTVNSQPFFLWLHLMDPHAPHYPAEAALQALGARSVSAFRARYLNAYWNRSDLEPAVWRKNRDAVVELYDAGIRWVDLQMARLVQRLQDLALWDGCAFAFTADHGEEFLEHGARFHAPWTMKEELIRVPLLVRIPGVTGGRVSETPFSHVDLAPTLVNSLGLPVPSSFRGQSLWRKWRDREAWEHPAVVDSTECFTPSRPETRGASRVLCVRESRYKLIFRMGTGTDELFDLQTDPGETSPLPDSVEKAVRRRLLEHARQHLQNTMRDINLEQRLRGRLRDLKLSLSNAAPRAGAAVV